MMRRIYKIIKNKYVITTVVFFVWILVFDKNNLISQINLAKKLKEIKKDKAYYIEQIKKDEAATRALLTDPEKLEKFAREKYFMKRDSEDIFIVVNEDTIKENSKK